MASIKATRDAIKALPGMTALHADGEWRVTINLYQLSERYPDKKTAWCEEKQEAMAYYTEDAEDALATARNMSHRWVEEGLSMENKEKTESARERVYDIPSGYRDSAETMFRRLQHQGFAPQWDTGDRDGGYKYGITIPQAEVGQLRELQKTNPATWGDHPDVQKMLDESQKDMEASAVRRNERLDALTPEQREFIEVLHYQSNGTLHVDAALDVNDRLHELAVEHHRLAQISLSESGLSKMQERVQDDVETKIILLSHEIPGVLEPKFMYDPRGTTVGLMFESGAHDSLNGSYKVPLNPARVKELANENFQAAIEALERADMKALGAVAPEIVQEVAMEKTKSLASDLSKIAMGEMYSDRVLRESVERLEALRDQPEHANPEITKDRINQALVHCKLALHGVRDTHHRLQDASWLIAVADGLGVEHGQSVPANEDPRWKAQMQGLREVTASINASLAPEVIKADFEAEKLREYGEDVGLKFGGKVETFDDGTVSAGFTRDADDGMVYHVALMVPPGATQVTAYTALGKGDQVLIESEPMPRDSVIGGLDAAVASFDNLKAKMPTAEATTQAEAQALAQRAAGEMNATLDDWVQSPVKEWVRSTMTTPDGKTIRVSASTGGVVSINGDPFTPDGDRILNVTHEAVATSMRIAVDRTPAPFLPIKMDRVFADAPGETGVAWANLCEEENRLAGYLSSLEEGTAVVHGNDAWYLEKGEDQQLVLMHGEVVCGKIENAKSRFQIGLDWVDMEAENVRAYTALVSSVADDFMIDRELWKTMKVELDETPSPSM